MNENENPNHSVFESIADYADAHLKHGEKYVIVGFDDDDTHCFCNAETEQDIVALSANANLMIGKCGVEVSGNEDYRACVALAELRMLIENGELHPIEALKVLSEGAPYVFLKKKDAVSFGGMTRVYADFSMASDSVLESLELFSLTMSSFIQHFYKDEDAVFGSAAEAVAFAQAALNLAVENLKKSGELPECFTLTDVGSDPMSFVEGDDL